MFTDIVGYSALMSKDEKLAMNILEKNRNIHKTLISKFSGEYIKEIGDGTLAIFHSSLDAVNCAIKIMKSCLKESSYSLRIGIHIGDIIFRDSDIFGDGVNIASRIEACGKSGGIYISERVYEDIKNKHEIKSGFVDERMLKNIDFPVKIYFIDAEGSSILKSPVRNLDQVKSAQIKNVFLTPKKLIITGGIAVVLLIIAVLVLFGLSKQRKADLPERIAVAVFENRTGDASLDELGKITCDWITRGLSQTKEIEVVPSTTVMQISGLLLDPGTGKRQNNYLEQLAKETMAQVIVSGSYYIRNKSLQFQAEVKNVTDGKLIYSMPVVSESMDHSMEIIEKVNSEIAGGLDFHFHSQEIQFVSKPPSKEAYSEYITGLEYFGTDYAEAIHHFIKSVENDSLFMQPRFFMASAFSGLGEYLKADSVFGIINRNRVRLTQFERHMLDFNIAFIKGNYISCLHYLRLAEVISPGDRQTNYLIGLCALRLNKPGMTVDTYTEIEYPYAKYSNYLMGAWRLSVLANALHLLGEYNKELVETRKGQQYYPNMFWFYEYEIRAYAAIGKIKEIEKIIEKCSSISSKSDTEGDVIMEAAVELRAHDHPQEGQKYAELAVEWFQNHPMDEQGIKYLGEAFYQAGNYVEAKLIFQKLASEYPDKPEFIGWLGVLAVRMGNNEDAVNYDEVLEKFKHPYLFGNHTYWRSRIAALMNEPERAVNLLNESFAQGNRFGVYIHRNIDFESLKEYAPFQELIKVKD